MKKLLKRILAGALTAAICLLGPVDTIYADNAEDEAKKAAEEALAKEKAEVLALPIETNALTNWPQGPGVYANSAIVMDINSGAILYAKRIDERHFPASITKILTTLVALENSELTDEVLFTQESVDFLEPGDAYIGMRPGEILTMEDSLYAVLLASANEVSHAVGEAAGAKLGGDYNTFLQEMNRRAEELGCTGSHWMNTNGLHHEEHYTTAHDMALIGAEVYGWEQFRKTTQTLQYTIPPTNLEEESRTFQQNHKMLHPENQYYYEHCTGGKTGYTDQARTTLVTFADNEQLQLVAVNLRSYGAQVYVDTTAMFEYAFANFSKKSISGYEDKKKVDKYLTEDPYVVLPEGVDLDQLEVTYEIVEGNNERQAIAHYTYGGNPVGNVEVILKRGYYNDLAGIVETSDEEVDNANNFEKDVDKKQNGSSVIVVIFAAGIFVLALTILVCIKLDQKKKRAMRKRRRKKRVADNIEE